jgi:hypothetical protein
MVRQWFGFKITGTISFNLASKPVATVSSNLALKPVATVSLGLTSKPVVEGFPVYDSKPADTVWLFGSQNYRDGFLV